MPKMTDTVRTQAAAIAQGLQAQADRIDRDPNLSRDGKRLAAAKSFQSAREQMQALELNFQGGAAITANDLSKRLFGSTQQTVGADAIAMRDAYDRSSRIEDPAEAEQLLATAEMTGDEYLAKAVAHQAYRMSQQPLIGEQWGEVVNTYAATRPDASAQLQEYADARANDLRDSLTNGAVFYLEPPQVISDLADYRIEQLARSDA